VEKQDFSVRFDNPTMVSCHKTKDCQQQDCPCFGKDPMRCWQVAGTFCGGDIQGEFARKHKNCVECEVYKSSSVDPEYMIGEEFNNMMHVLEKKGKELRESEERFRAVSESANDAIVSVDADGNVFFWNNAATEMFGYSFAEMMGASLTRIIPEKLRKAHKQGMENFLSTGEPKVIGHTVELVGLRKDGDEFPLDLSLATWKEGDQLFFTGIIRDITARKEMEEALLRDKDALLKFADSLKKVNDELKNTQAQMLQREKMASVGQLAAGVAHEINNPMGFITSNLSTLEKYVAKFTEFIAVQSEALASVGAADKVQDARKKLKLDFLIEDTGDLLHESLDGAKRVTEIVRNLKSFSRVDEAAVNPANINDCIETTLKIIWNELKYKTKVYKEYGDLPDTLCNSQELNQVFMNILVNAAQAIEKQGDITIRTWEEENTIKIAISDTGGGIAADKLNRIFEPFFTTKEVGKGTGLGLSICYDIMKKHEGEIAVESEVGKGTTFTVILPVKTEENI